MYQKFLAIGRLGQDPELRYTPTEGVAVCNFSIAVDRYVKEGNKETDWFRIIAWRKQAENCATYLTKGKMIFVEGRVQVRQYDDKEGQKRTAVEIVANNILFLSPKGDVEGSAGSNNDNYGGDGDEDVPF